MTKKKLPKNIREMLTKNIANDMVTINNDLRYEKLEKLLSTDLFIWSILNIPNQPKH